MTNVIPLAKYSESLNDENDCDVHSKDIDHFFNADMPPS